jgi:dipeptidyl aminopeptidase/acylaminoacyl peptidase
MSVKTNVLRLWASRSVYLYLAFIFFFFVVGFKVPIRAQGKHEISLDDLLTLKEGTYPQQLSPDGGLLAYWQDGYIWIVATQQGSVPRRVTKGYLPNWSPDGKRFAYYSDAPGNFQICIFNIETSRPEQITHLAHGIDPDPLTGALNGSVVTALHTSWSPDGTKLAFSSQVSAPTATVSGQTKEKTKPRVSNKGEPLVLTKTTPAEWTLSGVFAKAFPTVGYGAFWEQPVLTGNAEVDAPPEQKFNQLFVVDVSSKEATQLTHDNSVYAYPEWSRDGKRILCVSREGRDWTDPITNLYVVDVITGQKVTVTSDSSTSKGAPSWSPDGKYIAYENRKTSGGYAKVFMVRSGGGHAVEVTSHLDRYVLEYVWSPESKSIIIGYVDAPSFLSIARVGIEEQHVQPIGDQNSAGREFITISSTGSLAWQQSDPLHPWIICMLPAGGTTFVLVDFNPQAKNWQFAHEEVLHYKNTRAEDLEGILIKPADYQPGRRYPTIVDAYPIKMNEFKGWPMKGNQAWAARGYAVFMPISRAPNGIFLKSERFSKAAQGGPRGWDVTVDDIMSGVDEVIRLGVADPDRMGLYGFSNGGGVVNYLVTRTHRFKCAVSVAPGLSDWIRPVLMHTGFGQLYGVMMNGKLLWDEPSAYVEMSAVFRVDRVKTPMLLAVGDEDGEFLLDQIEMFNGLRQFGQEVTLLRYPDQGHGFSGAALKDFWDRENAFFDEHLKREHPLN